MLRKYIHMPISRSSTFSSSTIQQSSWFRFPSSNLSPGYRSSFVSLIPVLVPAPSIPYQLKNNVNLHFPATPCFALPFCLLMAPAPGTRCAALTLYIPPSSQTNDARHYRSRVETSSRCHCSILLLGTIARHPSARSRRSTLMKLTLPIARDRPGRQHRQVSSNSGMAFISCWQYRAVMGN